MAKQLTLDLGSSHDLMVPGTEPHVRLCTDSAEPAWDSVSPSLSAPLTPQKKKIIIISKLRKKKTPRQSPAMCFYSVETASKSKHLRNRERER